MLLGMLLLAFALTLRGSRQAYPMMSDGMITLPVSYRISNCCTSAGLRFCIRPDQLRWLCAVLVVTLWHFVLGPLLSSYCTPFDAAANDIVSRAVGSTACLVDKNGKAMR